MVLNWSSHSMQLIYFHTFLVCQSLFLLLSTLKTFGWRKKCSPLVLLHLITLCTVCVRPGQELGLRRRIRAIQSGFYCEIYFSTWTLKQSDQTKRLWITISNLQSKGTTNKHNRLTEVKDLKRKKINNRKPLIRRKIKNCKELNYTGTLG